jgi:hypothetical protein
VPRFDKGDRVSQPQYGNGTIMEVDDNHTVIDFDEHGVRKFVSRLVTLTKSSEPAPQKAPTRRSKKPAAKPAAKSAASS